MEGQDKAFITPEKIGLLVSSHTLYPILSMLFAWIDTLQLTRQHCL